jgi:hypothetical protein
MYKVSHRGAFKDQTQIAVSSQSGQVNLVFLLPAKWLFSLIFLFVNYVPESRDGRSFSPAC